MKRFILSCLSALVFAGCASTGSEPGNRPTRVSWEEAVAIVTSGGVETVFQTHNRDVHIQMEDGRVFETREPRIDMIFDVIDDCGEPCEQIMKVTE